MKQDRTPGGLSMAPEVFAPFLGGARVAGACTTGRGEFGQPVCQIRTRRAASAPSPEGNTGNPGQDLRAEKQRELVAICLVVAGRGRGAMDFEAHARLGEQRQQTETAGHQR